MLGSVEILCYSGNRRRVYPPQACVRDARVRPTSRCGVRPRLSFASDPMDAFHRGVRSRPRTLSPEFAVPRGGGPQLRLHRVDASDASSFVEKPR